MYENNPGKHMTYALMNACKSGDIQKVTEIIKNGFDLDHLVVGDPCLIHAVKANEKEIALLLIENGADVNRRGSNNETALMSAVMNQNYGIIQILIEKSAKINDQTLGGMTSLMYATTLKNIKLISLLIDNGADINLKENNGISVTSYAATNGLKDILELFLNNDADINSQNANGNTSLFSASAAIVELLMIRGADQNITNKNGQSAYDQAVKNNFIEIQVLLKPELINEPDENGNTLIMKACLDEDLVYFLIDRKADITIKNNDGKTVIDVLQETTKLTPKLESLKEYLILNMQNEEESALGVSI